MPLPVITNMNISSSLRNTAATSRGRHRPQVRPLYRRGSNIAARCHARCPFRPVLRLRRPLVRFGAKGPSPLTADLSAWAAGPARWRAFGAKGFPDHRVGSGARAGAVGRRTGHSRAGHWLWRMRGPRVAAHSRPVRRDRATRLPAASSASSFAPAWPSPLVCGNTHGAKAGSRADSCYW